MLVSFVSKSKGKEEYLPKQSWLQFCLKGEGKGGGGGEVLQ